MRTLLRVAAALILLAAAVVSWIWITTNFDTNSGPGWQLIGAGRGGPWSFFADEPVLAEVVADQSSLDGLWSLIPMPSTPPRPDFQRQIVVRVTGFGSGSCPLHFDGLELAGDRLLARMSEGFVLACTADAVPYSFLLLVERDRLPEGSFPVVVESETGTTETEIDGT